MYRDLDQIPDRSALTPQLIHLEGYRVEVETTYGETRRFWIGRSTGWKPCHLEIARRNHRSGPPAERSYKSVKVIKRPSGR